jgi:hypothetical protein
MTNNEILVLIQKELNSKNIYYQVWEDKKDKSIFVLTEYGLGDMIRIGQKEGKRQVPHYKNCKYYIGPYINKATVKKKYFYFKDTEKNIKKLSDTIINYQKNRIIDMKIRRYIKKIKKYYKKQLNKNDRFVDMKNSPNFNNEKIRLSKILNTNGMSTYQARDYLLKKINEHKFFVQVYESYISTSIYLKLDFGAANSLRISDHRGKGYSYYFNIWTCIDEREEEIVKGKKRYYFPGTKKDIDNLVKKIREVRAEKIKKYGKDRYIYYVKQNFKEGKKSKDSFWEEARLVQKW